MSIMATPMAPLIKGKLEEMGWGDLPPSMLFEEGIGTHHHLYVEGQINPARLAEVLLCRLQHYVDAGALAGRLRVRELLRVGVVVRYLKMLEDEGGLNVLSLHITPDHMNRALFELSPNRAADLGQAVMARWTRETLEHRIGISMQSGFATAERPYGDMLVYLLDALRMELRYLRHDLDAVRKALHALDRKMKTWPRGEVWREQTPDGDLHAVIAKLPTAVTAEWGVSLANFPLLDREGNEVTCPAAQAKLLQAVEAGRAVCVVLEGVVESHHPLLAEDDCLCSAPAGGVYVVSKAVLKKHPDLLGLLGAPLIRTLEKEMEAKIQHAERLAA